MKRKIRSCLTIVVLIANLLPLHAPPAYALEPARASAAEKLAAPSSASALPNWFKAPAAANRDLLPNWFGKATTATESEAAASLPGWFAPPSDVLPRPLALPIPGLEVTPTAPDNVSAGNFYGDAYTVTIRNPCNPITGTNFYITASIPISGFAYVGGSANLVSSINGPVAVNDSYTHPVVTWTPVTTYNLVPCEIMTLTFKMTTDGDAVSGQRLDVNAVYENPPGDPGSSNGGVNVTVGRGNLFVSKSPSIQDGTYGDVIAWTVEVGNTGLGKVYSATLSDLFGMGYTATNASQLALPPFHLEIGERRSFNVTATVNSCENLTNTALAWWSIGNDEGNGVATNPVSDTTDVAYLLETPQITLDSHDVAFEYCNPTPKTVVVTATNSGGPALEFALDSNVNIQPFAVGSVSSDWAYNPGSGLFSYIADNGVLASTQVVTLSFVVTPTFDVCNSGAGNGSMRFEARYENPCHLAFSGPATSAAYSYGAGEFPALNISKSSSTERAFTGDTIQFFVDFSADNVQNISGSIVITDFVTDAFSVTNISQTAGAMIQSGNDITWTVPTPGSGNLSGRMTVTVQVVDALGVCDANSARTNTANAAAEVSCSVCPPLTGSDSAQVILQNGVGTAFPKGSSSDFQVCGLLTMTNQYSVTVNAWSGVRFTETLGFNDGVPGDDVPPGTLNYVPGSLSVVISGTDVSAEVVIAQASPQLVLDFAGITLVPTGTHDIAIAYSLYISDTVLAGQPEINFFDWSEFHVPGAGGSGSCTGDNTFRQGADVTLQRADLQIGISPNNYVACATVPVVLTVSDDDLVAQSLVANNIVVTFTVGDPDFNSIDLGSFVYGGGFAGNPVVTATAGNVITWTFQNPLTQTGTTTGSIRFNMTRSCDAPPLQARVQFDDRCSINYGDAAVNNNSVGVPDVHLFVTPDTYMVNENKARWRMYVTNVGAGTAGRVLITDELGLGLRFISYTADFPLQVNRLTPSPFAPGQDIVWEVLNLASGQQVRLDVYADVVDCGGLTSRVTMDASCLDGSCPSSGSDELVFILPAVAVRSSNAQTADLPFCDVGEVILTVKNASVSAHIYEMIITETVTLVAYVPGTAHVTVTNRSGVPYPDLTNVPFEPVTTPVGADLILLWSLSNPGINPTQTNILADRAPEDSITIRYELKTDCSSPGASQVQAEAAGLQPCSTFFFRKESAVTLDVAEPEITLSKAGRNVTRGDAVYSTTVYAEPNDIIVWRVTANNAIGANIAQNVMITDTAPFNFIVTDASTGTLGGGTLITSSNAVTWDVGLLPADGVDWLLWVTGTVAAQPDSCQLLTTNQATLQYGCDDGCRAQPIEASADLRTRPSLQVQMESVPQLSLCGGPFTITLVNNGPPAYGVVLTDTLPAGLVYSDTVAASTAPLTYPNYGDNPAVWAWGAITLPTGNTTLVFRVNSGSSGTCAAPSGGSNDVSLFYEDYAVCTVGGPYTATDSSSITIVSPTLGIEKTPFYQVADVGQVVTWTVTVSNTSPVEAPGIIVTDTIGSGFGDSRVITWAVGTLPASGGTWSATVTATVAAGGAQTNTVQVRGDCAAGCTYATAEDTAYVTLLKDFNKGPEIQTHTIGGLVVFTFTTTLPDVSALYENLTLTDTLPTGLGYVAATLVYTYNDPPGTSAISSTPTLTPGWLAPGDVVWALGDLPGAVQVNGVITAVVRDIASNYDGVRRTNLIKLSYTDDSLSYVYTDTAGVDVVEPVLHVGKSYVTPPGCDATLFQDNFNATADGNNPAGWSLNGTWPVYDGIVRSDQTSNNQRAFAGDRTWTDYSFSFMVRSTDASGAIGAYVRQDDNDADNRGYRLYWTTSQMRLDSQNPNAVGLASKALGYQVGHWHHVEILVTGNQVRVFVDGVQHLSYTDALNRQPLGRIGLYSHQNLNTEFDDVLVTRLDDMACTVGANDPVTYTLVVSNQSQRPGYELVITDALPAGLSLLTYTLDSNDPTAPKITTEPAPIPGATDVLTWGVDHLTPTMPFDPRSHTALTLTVILTVSDGITANVVLPNQASLSYDNWLTDTQPTTITRAYSGGSHSAAVRTVDGSIVKTTTFDPPPTPTLGTLITYTLFVPAPPITATLYEVVVTDTLDSRLFIENVAFSGGSGASANWSGQVVTGTFASIPHDTQATITVTARISHEWPNPAGDANVGDVLTNTAVMTHPAGDTITETNEVSTTVGEPQLTLVKASDPPTSNTVGAGDLVTYTVTITNWSDPDASPAYDVAFTDTLPVGMRDATPVLLAVTLDALPVAPGDYVTGYVPASGVLTIAFTSAFSIPVGSQLIVRYVAMVDTDVGAGADLGNQAQVVWSSLPSAVPGDRDYGPISDATTVHTPPAAGLDKVRTPPTVTVGSRVVFTMTLPEPTINATIYGVVFTDVVDGRLRIDAVSPNATYSGQVVTATFASIPSQTQEIVIITTTVRDVPAVFDGALITNAAAFDYTGNPSGTLPSEVVTITVREPNVVLNKSVQAPRNPLGAGDVVTYTLALANGGNWPAYDLVITDQLPNGLAFIATQAFTVTDPATATRGGDYPAWTVSQLNVGGDVYITFTARVSAAIGAGQTLTNAAWGEYDNWPGEPPDEREYPIPTDTVPVDTGYPALDLLKSAAPSPVEAGGALTYTLRLTNTGIVSATDVIITDPVPTNTTYQSCDPNPCGEAGGVVSWTLGTLDVGASRVVTMVVTVTTPLATGAITNTAWTTSSEGLTDTDTVTTPLQPLSLGDLVWYDHDNDGVYEPGAGESGTPGVTVTLYRSGDVLGVTPPLSTTTTDGDGRYLFTGLDAGGYFVHIPSNNFEIGQPLEGYTSTVPTEFNPDNNQNEGVDENGVPDSYGVSSGVITLTYGAEPTGEDVLGIDTTPDDHSNLTVDFGFYQPFSLGDLVWYDHDNDGVYEPGVGETGVASVTVELYRPGDVPSTTVPLSTTTTDVNGRYLFTGLIEGGYFVHIPPSQFGAGQPLLGYESTVPTEPDPNTNQNEDVDENGVPVTGGAAAIEGVSSGVVTLTVGAEPMGDDVLGIDPGTPDGNSNLTIDFGFFQPLSLGDLVWYDDDNDGVYEPGAGESGVAGVTVELYRPGDVPSTTVPLSTTTTDANGRYLFTDLGKGGYFVHIPPGEFGAGRPLLGYESTVPTEPDPNTNQNENVDENGVPLVAGATAVEGVSSGVVTLTVGAEPMGEDVLGIDLGTPDGNSNLSVDFGFFRPLSLGDLVWFDLDNDGVFEPGAGETGVSGVTVELYRPGDVPSTTVPLSTTATDVNGRYLFTDLGEGGYFVHIPPGEFGVGRPLEGYESTVPTEPNADNDQNEDVDENGVPVAGGAAAVEGVSSGVVTLTVGAEPTGEDVLGMDPGTPDDNSNLTVDFGFYSQLSLGDLVWYDHDNDGVFEPGAGETGVAGVTVELYRPGDVPSATVPLSTTTTDANGRYLFLNLGAGGYFVHIPPGEFGAGRPLLGYESTVPTEPDPNTNQNEDVDENGVPLVAGAAAIEGVSSGVVTLAMSTEPLGEDVLGIDPGTPDENSNLTLDFGFFRPLSLGDLVWYDDDNDGVFEPGAGETGVASVTVELYRPGDVPSTTVPLSTTTTDANGRYLFTDLGEGGYFVHIPPGEFGVGQPLEDYESTVPTEPNADNDQNEDVDENGVPVAGGAAAVEGVSSGVVTLTVGAEPTGEDVLGIDSGTPDDNSNLSVDFGFFARLSLGDLVWYDYDNDGVFEPGAGETGVPSVTVELYRAGDTLGVTPPLSTTATDANGRYLFTDLDAGGYFVHIPGSAFGIGQPLEGYTSTVPTEPNPDNDQNEDVDENGLPDSYGVSSGLITLTHRAEPTGEDVLGVDPGTPDDHSNLSVDFGFFQPLSLGDLVWYDHDNDGLFEPGAGESGVAGVTMELYRPSDVPGTTTPLSTTTTDANGRYLFSKLVQGSYFVHIPPIQFGVGQSLQGYESTVPTELNPDNDQNEDVDENGVPVAGGAAAIAGVSSGVVTLTVSGEPTGEDVLGIDLNTPDGNSNLTVDFGFFQPLSLGDLVWYDYDNDGVFEPGVGESGVAGVAVELYRPGDVPSTTIPFSSTATDANGRYLFKHLLTGGYFVHIPPSEFYPGQALEGYESTLPTEPNPNTDQNEDVDENGLPVAGDVAAVAGVSSGVVTLTVGAEPTSEDVLGVDPNTPDGNSNLTLDFGFFQPGPDLRVIKSVLPRIGANGQTLTYSIQLLNMGNVPLNPLRLDDRLPDGFRYNNHAWIYPPLGGASLEPDVVAEPTLTWNDVTLGAGLLAGQSMTLTFQVTVAAGVTGTFVNVVTATGTTPTEVVTDTDDVPIPIEDPAVDISKHWSGHDRDAGIVTFTIYISNVGPSALDVLPLIDSYDPHYLSFVNSAPYPQEDADDGVLSWYDLTGPAPYGFNRDLRSGEQFVITTVFAIAHDITNTINSVAVTGVSDVYDNSADDDQDDVPIVDTPTAIELLYLRATGQADGVQIEWATLLEVESYGFWLYRAVLDQFAQAVQITFQASQGSGDGAEYTYLDKEVQPGQNYWYWLVEVDNEGVQMRYGPVSAMVDTLALWHRLYLPLVIKASK